MPTGPIRPQVVEEPFDRRDTRLPVWERGGAAKPDLPWRPAAEVPEADLRRELDGAEVAVAAVTTSRAGRTILDAIAKVSASSDCRIYIYADRALEAESGFLRAVAAWGDRCLVRFGHRLPADWIVFDHGQHGHLFMGPPASERTWAVPVDAGLARSLFEAFRVLFWFHASREALPDAAGAVAVRAPLNAPFRDPGSQVDLPAGRLLVGVAQPAPVADAEIRVSPLSMNPGPARVVFLPPAEAADSTAMSLAVPSSVAAGGARVVWSDLGLPHTTVTLQRVLLDLVEAPVTLQLEWPRAIAIDLLHRLERAGAQPQWEFHPARRLSDIRGDVRIEGSRSTAKVTSADILDAGDVTAPLVGFDAARPARMPEVPPLASAGVTRWRRVPVGLPPGARPAEVVRAWTMVDEWAARQPDPLRTALRSLDEQEGILAKLRRWLPARTAVEAERRALGDEIDELAETRPSQSPDRAPDQVRRYVEIGARLDELRREGHAQRQKAEDAEAEDQQRAAWQARNDEAKQALNKARERLKANEDAAREAGAEEEAAKEAHRARVELLRKERRDALETERTELEQKLAGIRERLRSSAGDAKGGQPSSERKELGRQQQDTEQALARSRKEREGIERWSPAAGEVAQVAEQVSAADRRSADLRRETATLNAAFRAAEAAANVAFRFDLPPRGAAPPRATTATPPKVPDEAPPELGDLFEHQNRRYLAIRTWEQLNPAIPVAKRLNAELVASPPSP